MKKQLRLIEGAFIFATLITLLVYLGLYAAEEALPSPQEIIAKNIEARGGIEALKKIKNKKIVSMERKWTRYQERPDKTITIQDFGAAGKYKSGSDGKMLWEINPFRTPRMLEGDELSNHLMEILFDGPDGPDARYTSMKTESIEQINGKPCYKVVKTPEKGPQRTVYYDTESFMIVKTTTDQKGNNKYSRYIEKYQKINNILFPYKIVTFVNGKKAGEMTYDKIELNMEIPEGIFDLPEEIKAIMDKK